MKKLYIHNYKSFYDTTVELDKFNIIVAPNNAGKSNLIDVLEFINIALEYDIERAIKEKGGFEKIRNYKSDEEKIVIEFLVEQNNKDLFQVKAKIGVNEDGVIFNSKGAFRVRITIAKDYYQVTIFFNIGFKIRNYKVEGVEKNQIRLPSNKDENKLYNQRYRYSTFTISKKSFFDKSKKVKNKLFFNKLKNKNYIERYLVEIISFFRIDYSDREFKSFYNFNTSTYYFHPELIKQKSHLETEKKLQKNGANLGANLAFIKEYDREKNTNFFEKISYSVIGIVDEVNEVYINNTSSGLYLIDFKENGKDKPNNINIVSDGTVNLIATVTALNQPNEDSFMLAFEEPERHLHLKAVNYLLDGFRENKKQILITTHSTEILNNAKLEEIIFMYRDSYGDTQTIRADKIKDLKGKLKRLGYKKDLSISELIDENILGDLEDY